VPVTDGAGEEGVASVVCVAAEESRNHVSSLSSPVQSELHNQNQCFINLVQLVVLCRHSSQCSVAWFYSNHESS